MIWTWAEPAATHAKSILTSTKMKKKLQIREDGKARFALQDDSMVANRWFKDQEVALRWLGKQVLAGNEDTWMMKFKWRSATPSESQREAAGTADEKPDGQAENSKLSQRDCE
jgi:hypothetical protein